MMRTLAEMFGFRPTKFIPNGCGGWLTEKLMPDELVGVNFDDCCDLHDLGYHVGKGGFSGILTEKPFIDYALASCMDDRFGLRFSALWLDGRRLRATGVFAVFFLAPVAYFVALTLLGWTPLTWPWKERPMPSHEDLERLLAHNRND